MTGAIFGQQPRSAVEPYIDQQPLSAAVPSISGLSLTRTNAPKGVGQGVQNYRSIQVSEKGSMVCMPAKGLPSGNQAVSSGDAAGAYK